MAYTSIQPSLLMLHAKGAGRCGGLGPAVHVAEQSALLLMHNF